MENENIFPDLIHILIMIVCTFSPSVFDFDTSLRVDILNDSRTNGSRTIISLT